MAARYRVALSPEAVDHLRQFSARDAATVLEAIEIHLSLDPEAPSKRRKKLSVNPLAGWELRIGDFRAFYDVTSARRLVEVRAIGVKVHNQLLVAGAEYDLR
jgi:mRNA-degrading endonuclease RelE of RelBE toxin-antitoxin system